MTRLKRISAGTQWSAMVVRKASAVGAKTSGGILANYKIALTKAIAVPDGAAAKHAFDAMMQMKKSDIAAIEAAQRG